MISILIPCYNRENFIEQTIRSALAQTRTDIEIIVVDNCSTDDTWTIICKLQQQDPRIKIFQNQVNLGPIKNWERCILEASGEYAKILWSDDLISPSFLEKTVSILESRNDVGFVYTRSIDFIAPLEINNEREINIPASIFPSENFIIGAFSNGNVPYSPGNALFRLKDLRESLVVQIPNIAGRESSQHGIGPDLLFYLITCTRYAYYSKIDAPLAFFEIIQTQLASVLGKRN